MNEDTKRWLKTLIPQSVNLGMSLTEAWVNKMVPDESITFEIDGIGYVVTAATLNQMLDRLAEAYDYKQPGWLSRHPGLSRREAAMREMISRSTPI